MKKLKLFLLLFACTSLLTGCHNQTEYDGPIDDSPIVSDNPGNTFGNVDNSIISESDSTPPKEGMLRSRLTNEWVEAPVANTRPIAVMIPNEKAAIPHYNLSDASILYEANVEGQMTRMMAIYEDWVDLDKIGNVRSLRTYFAYWSFEWDAFLVHYGGPFYIDTLMAEPSTQYVNGTLSLDGEAFFRASDRREPHNAYISGNDVYNIIEQKGYDFRYRDLAEENHFKFAPDTAPNTLAQYGDAAQTATYIDMSGAYPLTRCYFEYNEDDGLYYRSQHLSGGIDSPHVDADGEQLTFKNILVQNTYYEEMDDGYLVFQCHDTTRDGWYFTNGKAIHVTWKKTADYNATRYYDDNGDEIFLNTGKTMICIVEDGDTFTFH